jgi:hypothetical protein
MKTLQNFARPLTVYVGEFATDDMQSDINLYSYFDVSYSDFMAFFYPKCEMIDTNDNKIKFLITETRLESALVDYREVTDKEYNLIKYDL